MSCVHGSFGACYECRGDELVRLRSRLAAVTKERDTYKKDWEHEDRRHMEALARENELEVERDALRADNATLLANADADALMLTQVGRERDEARELHARAVELGAAVLDNETTALKARVAALESALEPTCEIVEATLAAAMTLPEGVRISVRSTTELVVRAIRARAGLDAKEGGVAKGRLEVSARERDPEAVLRDLMRAQDALLRAYRLGDSNGASAADRCRELREELWRIDAKGGDRG